MVVAADKKREEAMPKGMEFMPKADTEQLTAAFEERVGKYKSIPEACLLRRRKMGPYQNAYGRAVRPYAAHT